MKDIEPVSKIIKEIDERKLGYDIFRTVLRRLEHAGDTYSILEDEKENLEVNYVLGFYGHILPYIGKVGDYEISRKLVDSLYYYNGFFHVYRQDKGMQLLENMTIESVERSVDRAIGSLDSEVEKGGFTDDDPHNPRGHLGVLMPFQSFVKLAAGL